MRSSRIVSMGKTAWALIGIIVLLILIFTGLGALSGILTPLLIAAILGTVLEPLVSYLKNKGLNQALSALIGLVVAILLSAVLIFILVRGFLGQLPEISRELMLGWQSFLNWGRSLELDIALLERLRLALSDYLPVLGQGALGAVSSTFSGAITLFIGTFFSVFFLFFVMKDTEIFSSWIARMLPYDDELVQGVISEVKTSIRSYFKGTAITALITAPVFMIPLLILRVPLAIPIFILYFFLSFIPFLGAWITGAFAILIAFGSGGPTAALIITLSLFVSNGTIQSVVSSWALGATLRIHPVTVLLSTLILGTIGGILGMILGAPLVASFVKSLSFVKEYKNRASA